MEFLKFFTSETMSIHLKQGQKPLGKIGKPGSFSLEVIDDVTITNVILDRMITEILDSVESSEATNIEISKKNAFVVQHRDYKHIVVESCVPWAKHQAMLQFQNYFQIQSYISFLKI